MGAEKETTANLRIRRQRSVSDKSPHPLRRASNVRCWAIKSSVESIAALSHAKEVDLDDLLDLPDPPDVTNNDARYRENLIPAFDNDADLKEGAGR